MLKGTFQCMPIAQRLFINGLVYAVSVLSAEHIGTGVIPTFNSARGYRRGKINGVRKLAKNDDVTY